MYSDWGFCNEVDSIDRMKDKNMEGWDEVYLYIKVTSFNGFTIKYYEVTVKPA
jgi:hypothetical protein